MKNKINVPKILQLISALDINSGGQQAAKEILELLLQGILEDPTIKLEKTPITDVAVGDHFTREGQDIYITKLFAGDAHTPSWFFTGIDGNPHNPYGDTLTNKAGIIRALNEGGWIKA